MTNNIVKKFDENENKTNLICSAFTDFFNKCCSIGFIDDENYKTMKNKLISLFKTNYREVEIANTFQMSQDDDFNILDEQYDSLCRSFIK